MIEEKIEPTTPTESYFAQRMQELGIIDSPKNILFDDPAHNIINIWRHDAETKTNVLKPVKIFRESDKGIDIFVFSLERNQVTVKTDESRFKKDYCITRLAKPVMKNNGDVIKYVIPKGGGTFPFFHPSLIEKYEKKIPITTLYLTEGFFKAFKGCMHGLDVVGLSSITHMKDKEGKLHEDILKILIACKVQKVVWLMDGDCNNLTKKELEDGIDLYKRPNGFFQSAVAFKTLLSAVEFEALEKWAVYPKSEVLPNHAKGLDDALISFAGKELELTQDLQDFSKTSLYFEKVNITWNNGKLLRQLHLHDVNSFYIFHSEKHQNLKNIDFKFHGTLYHWNDLKGKCDVVIPGDAKNFFRVGDQYHAFVHIPNKYGELETTFHRRQKTTITDDYGKEFCKHIPKYEAFCNTPDHLNHQQVINNCFNLYAKFEHEPSESDVTLDNIPATMQFLQHIFGTNSLTFTNPKTKEKKEFNETDLGLDYVQLLYTKPTQILPILCLVSKENNTGKSTFAKWLKLIFTANVAIVGNAELKNNFNASWASKLLVICDEAKIDKLEVVEKVKSLSTADKIFMEAKGKDHVEIDFFGKFIFLTNNEENFIFASDDDVRYWVRKVKPIRDLNISLLQDMIEEIPDFLAYLNRRKLATDNLHRGWFDPKLIETEALKRVIAHSMPTVQKEINQQLRDLFLDFGVDEILMSRKVLHKEFFNNKYEVNYIGSILEDKLKVDTLHDVVVEGGIEVKKYKTTRYRYPKFDAKPGGEQSLIWVSDIGRPYVFKRSQFVRPDEKQVTLDAEFQFQKDASEPIPKLEEFQITDPEPQPTLF